MVVTAVVKIFFFFFKGSATPRVLPSSPPRPSPDLLRPHPHRDDRLDRGGGARAAPAAGPRCRGAWPAEGGGARRGDGALRARRSGRARFHDDRQIGRAHV